MTQQCASNTPQEAHTMCMNILCIPHTKVVVVVFVVIAHSISFLRSTAYSRSLYAAKRQERRQQRQERGLKCKVKQRILLAFAKRNSPEYYFFWYSTFCVPAVYVCTKMSLNYSCRLIQFQNFSRLQSLSVSERLKCTYNIYKTKAGEHCKEK